MCLLHAARHEDGLSIGCIMKICLPVAGPADGSNQSVVASLQIKKRQRICVGRVPIERFEMSVFSRAEIFLQRFKISRRRIASTSMAEHTIASCSWNGPIQRQDVFNDGRIGCTIVAKPNDPIHDTGEIRIDANIAHHFQVGNGIRIGGSMNLAFSICYVFV